MRNMQKDFRTRTASTRATNHPTRAHLRVPPAEVFPFDDQFAWAGHQWEAVRQARDSGALKIRYDLSPTTDPGYLAL